MPNQRKPFTLIDDPALHGAGGRAGRWCASVKWPAASAPVIEEFSRQRDCGRDLGKRPRMTGAGQPHDFETRPLRWQTCSSADSADNQVWQCNRGIETALVQRFEARDTNCGFCDTRRVLSGGDEECSELLA